MINRENVKLINDFEQIHEIQCFDCVNCIIKLSDGNFAICDSAGYFQIYNSQNYRLEVSIFSQLSSINYICELSTNTFLCCSNKSISIWEILNKKEPYLINTFIAHELYITKIIKLSDGNFASCSKDIKIWNCKYPFKLIKKLDGHNNLIKSIIQLSDKRLISVSSFEENILIYWNINTGEKEKIIKNVKCVNNNSLIELPNYKIGVGGKNEIYIISSINYQIEIIIKAHNSLVNCLIVYNDTLLSSSVDGNIKQWNLTNFQCISNKIKAHENYILSLLQLNDNVIISSSDEGKVKIWEKKEN
jgi:WD40 repeat protein